MEIACIYGHKRMAPQVGLEPTTLRLTAVRVKTLSAVSSVAYRGVHPKSRPQLGYMGYTPALAAILLYGALFQNALPHPVRVRDTLGRLSLAKKF